MCKDNLYLRSEAYRGIAICRPEEFIVFEDDVSSWTLQWTCHQPGG